MAGNLFNLSDPNILLPDYFIIDTNILIDRFLRSVGPLSSAQPAPVQNAANLFQRLQNEGRTGLVTPTVSSELLHHAIGLYVKQEMSNQGAKGRWIDFYKNNPTIAQGFRTRLDQLISLVSNNHLLFLTPNDFNFPHVPYIDHLIDLCCRYGLDTNDAVILFEAECLEVDGIVSLDRDLRNTIADFNIYTWI